MLKTIFSALIFIQMDVSFLNECSLILSFFLSFFFLSFFLLSFFLSSFFSFSSFFKADLILLNSSIYLKSFIYIIYWLIDSPITKVSRWAPAVPSCLHTLPHLHHKADGGSESELDGWSLTRASVLLRCCLWSVWEPVTLTSDLSHEGHEGHCLTGG